MTTHALSTKWITDRNFDLAWYIGPSIASYFLLYLNLGLGVSVMLLWWLWVVVIDGPHVFGTISRTYLDRREWQERRGLLFGSLIWFLPGPLFVIAGIIAGSQQPYVWFLLLASLWAYWHVVRQHYGFLCLYQRKNGEPAGVANTVDYWCFYVMMIAPLGSFIMMNDMAREAMLLPVVALPAEATVLQLIRGAVVAAAALYLGKEFLRWRSGEQLDLPKNLFLLSCVSVHWVVCLVPEIAGQLHLLMFSALVTLHHGIQYHGIVWFHNRNRYQGEGARARHGRLATTVSRSFLTYYAAGLLFTFVVRYSSWIFTGMEDIPGGPGPNEVSLMSLGGGYTVSEFAVAFWWGFAFHHYYLDQRIWRVSRDKKLQRNLEVSGAQVTGSP